MPHALKLSFSPGSAQRALASFPVAEKVMKAVEQFLKDWQKVPAIT